MSVCVCARRHCERERNKRERELEEMGVLQSRMRMDISVVRGSHACTMRVPGSASAVHAPGLLPAPARDRDQCRAQDAHGAGRARRSAPQKWLTRWHPASPGSLNTYTWPSRCSVRRTRTAQDAHGQRPTKVAHPLTPGVSGASAWAPAADAPAPPRPGAPPTHHWNSLCQEPVFWCKN